MIVDKSHSKKDIIWLFKKHNVFIDKEKTKGEIVNEIESYIKDVTYNDKIKSISDLKDYLKSRSPKQRPTTEEKNLIMFRSKKIIKWAKNDYIYDGTYNNKNEPYTDMMEIYKWGDLSSVRRACKLYNISPQKINHINPIMTDEVKEEIRQNKIITKTADYKMIIRRATKEDPIIISFD